MARLNGGGDVKQLVDIIGNLVSVIGITDDIEFNEGKTENEVE